MHQRVGMARAFSLVLITRPRLSSYYYGYLLLLIALSSRDGIAVGREFGGWATGISILVS